MTARDIKAGDIGGGRRAFRPFSWLRALVAAVAVVSLAATLAACAPDIMPRGNIPSAMDLSTIQPGKTTRAEVKNELGTPSSVSLFNHGEDWFYIGAHTEAYAYHPIKELNREVVIVRFNKDGVVASVKKLDKADGEKLDIVQRKTPAPGRKLTIIQQFIGNFGRFNKSMNSSGGVPTGPPTGGSPTGD